MAVTLTQITERCKRLEDILVPCYGPQSYKTLISTNTGKVVLTSDGLVIAQALYVSDPVTELIVRSMESCKNSLGDGSKTFVSYLSGFLETMREYVCRESCGVMGGDVERRCRIELAESLSRLRWDLIRGEHSKGVVAMGMSGCTLDVLKSTEYDDEDCVYKFVEKANENVDCCMKAECNIQKVKRTQMDIKSSAVMNSCDSEFEGDRRCSQTESRSVSKTADSRVITSEESVSEKRTISFGEKAGSFSGEDDLDEVVNKTHIFGVKLDGELKTMCGNEQMQFGKNSRCKQCRYVSSNLDQPHRGGHLRETLRQLLTTQLGTKYRNNMAAFYARLMLQMISVNGEITSSNITGVLENVPTMFTKVVGEQPMKSHVMDGVLLCSMRHLILFKTDRVRFIIVDGDFSGNSTNFCRKPIVLISSNDQFKKSLGYKTSVYTNFIKVCVENGIDLILCSHKLPDTFVYLCNERRISVKEFVHDDDIKRLERVFSLRALSPFDLIGGDSIGSANSCENKTLDGKEYLNLAPYSESVLSRQLILFGTTPENCDQCHKTLLNSLVLLNCFLKKCEARTVENNISIENCCKACVMAGGAFEFYMCTVIDDVIKTCRESCDSLTAAACAVLRRGLLNVPKTLFRNAAKDTSVDTNVKYMIVENMAMESCTLGRLVGIDCTRGTISDSVTGIESFDIKLSIMSVAMETLCQLLRLDSIIGVRKLKVQ